jgi:5-(carboxyamino)imidazole ribonucleotide mutase
MPAGVPVATVAIGAAQNAGLLAVQIIAASDPALLEKMLTYKRNMAEMSRAKNQRF